MASIFGPSQPWYGQPNPWWVDALGRDASRLGQQITSGFMAPANALAGNYNQREIGPDGSVSPVDPRMVSDANNLAGMVSLGAPGGVPTGALGMGIKAYHGSPHSFDKFDMSKIGTGEGAQAYGHGLYFAENEGVAKSYRDALVDPMNTFIIDGKPVDVNLPSYGPQDQLAIRALGQPYAYHPETLVSRMKEAGMPPENLAKLESALASYKDRVSFGQANPGSVYAVDINAHPDQFLDWDKPLSAQSPDVRAKLEALDKGGRQPTNDPSYVKEKDGNFSVRIDLPDHKMVWGFGSTKDAALADANSRLQGTETGAEFYQRLSAKLGGDAQVSAALRDAGVPGVRYLDAGSRGAGDGTRNHVLFDDNLVNIEKKYGTLGGVPNVPPPPPPALQSFKLST